MSRVVLAMTVGALAACGADDDPGRGTRTLRVLARGFTGPSLGTEVTVDVSARGLLVLDADIEVRDLDSGEIANLVGQNGLYLGRLDADVSRLQLDIEAGEDNLQATIGGPIPFEITRPPADAAVSRGSSGRLLIQWARPEDEPIDEVDLSVTSVSATRDARGTIVADGQGSLPSSDFTTALDEDPGEGRVPLPSQPGFYRATAVRRDIIPLAGGTEGSELSLEYRRSVLFELVD
ncbi:MAG: hypothetical protein AAFU79_12470 [Myxococcota bacterium]